MTERARTVLVGGRVLDGTGAPARQDAIALAGDRIVAVGPRVDITAEDTVLDLKGRTVSPGFVDMHSHSDLQMLLDPTCPAKVTQGVTTELLGQDGLSYAPVDDRMLPQLRSRIRGWNGDPVDLELGWSDVAGYLNRLDRGTGCNAAYLVPHGNVRELVMGTRTGPASAGETAAQQELVRSGLQQGAFGLSAGLTYVPGMFAGTEELVDLCQVVADHGGLFVPHHRNYGSAALDGYAECFRIAARSGVRLHLSHTHLSWPTNHGRMPALLDLFDRAERDGVDFSFDAYPYLAGMSTLHAQFPSWAQVGEQDELRRLFGDPASRRRLREAMERTGSDGHSGLTVDWTTVVVAGVPAGDWSWTEGLSIAAAADRAGLDGTTLAMELLLGTDFAASCVMFVGHEPHVRTLMQHPRHTVGTDGILVGSRIHPRGWGTFARILGVYVRRDGVLALPEAIRHMTSAPADRLGLTDRGRIEVGRAADLVVFDPDTVDSPADYDHPRRPAVGIHHVWCNGIRTLADGRPTATLPGRALRHGTHDHPGTPVH